MKRIAMPDPDDRALWDMWMSAFQFQALAVADDLGIFMLLQGRPVAAEGIAVQLSLPTRKVEQLLAVLAGLGLLRATGHYFALTDTAKTYLLPDSPFYWGPALAYFRAISVSFESMRAAVEQPPRPAEPTASAGRASADAQAAEAFTRAMHSLAFPAATGVAERGDFVGVQHLLDVGGGSGAYCIALALRYPDKRFTVADVPEVAPTTRQYIAAYGVHEQVGVLPFDMFATPWPDSYDAHFFSNIFHGFDPAMCHQLANSSFAALPAGGRIYVHEVLLSDAKDGPLTQASFALAMTYFNGKGGQYTSAELAAILGGAGFKDVKTTATYGFYSLTSGRKGA